MGRNCFVSSGILSLEEERQRPVWRGLYASLGVKEAEGSKGRDREKESLDGRNLFTFKTIDIVESVARGFCFLNLFEMV